MSVEFKILSKAVQTRRAAFEHATNLAEQLLEFMNQDEVLEDIRERDVLFAASTEIQEVISGKARELGFQSEKKGLFAAYPTSALRPDCYCELDDSGIIMEVERGKTTTNNMDLLDLWKCHICTSAHFLFLIVPQFRVSANGPRLVLYQQVGRRLGTFFEEQNYVNVDAVFLFGY